MRKIFLDTNVLLDLIVRSGTSPDFEDNLQIMCAEYGGCDLIITDIPVLSPEEFVSRCSV